MGFLRCMPRTMLGGDNYEDAAVKEGLKAQVAELQEAAQLPWLGWGRGRLTESRQLAYFAA